MINTMFLVNQISEKDKTFSSSIVSELTSKVLEKKDKIKINTEVAHTTRNIQSFSISKGKVYLGRANQIFCLEHMQGNVDIVLPKPENILDWIVLWYDQDKTIFNVSYEKHSKIKLYGNGKKIMGFDEPLICDIPFMTLRLTFVNDIDGWIVT